MVRGSHRTGLTGSPLVRLLARLTEADASSSKHVFSERLSQWFDWTNAISLATALSEGSGARADTSAASPSVSRLAEEAARARGGLEGSITEDFARPPAGRPQQQHGHSHEPAPTMAADVKADLALWRRRYTAKQQLVDASVQALRGRLRSALAAGSPALAKLAALDEVMEQVLGEHERTLLSIVPKWLEQRFERLSNTQSPAEGLDALRSDMCEVLLAELDFRWQPIEGLLGALRAVPTHCNE